MMHIIQLNFVIMPTFLSVHRVTLSASVFEANESDGALEVMLMLQRSSTLSNTVSIRLKTRDLQETTSAIGIVASYTVFGGDLCVFCS